LQVCQISPLDGKNPSDLLPLAFNMRELHG
jgi:hypothetical protein